MRKVFLLSAGAALGVILGTVSPVFAGDNKADLVQIIRQEKSNLDSIVADKAMTFNMSPDWWQYFLNRDTRAYEKINLIAICMMHYGHNAGGDDIEDLDQAHDASSPLVLDAVNKLVEKVRSTIEFLEPVQADKKELALENLKTTAWAIRQKTVCKPRAQKLNIILVIAPKAKVLGCTVSNGGNTFRFLIPSSTHVEAGTVEEFFRKSQ